MSLPQGILEIQRVCRKKVLWSDETTIELFGLLEEIQHFLSP